MAFSSFGSPGFGSTLHNDVTPVYTLDEPFPLQVRQMPLDGRGRCKAAFDGQLLVHGRAAFRAQTAQRYENLFCLRRHFSIPQWKHLISVEDVAVSVIAG